MEAKLRWNRKAIAAFGAAAALEPQNAGFSHNQRVTKKKWRGENSN
jgi:hypothetical protein